MKILFLDDERTPEMVRWISYPKDAEFTVVRSVKEFLKTVKEQPTFNVWSLDHDLGIDGLGDIAPTGYDAIQLALMSLGHKAPSEVWVHSKNPVGAANIANYWKSWRRCQ